MVYFSTGLQGFDANDIVADNITIWSNLNVSGTTNLNNLLNVQGVNILNPINNFNNIINNDLSTIKEMHPIELISMSIVHN